ncbi:polysaccharide pyruvyl transferase family protein [Vibrio cyclitrophicus]
MSYKVLVEYYGALNFGDDLFIKVLSERYPDTVFFIVCKNKYSKPLVNMKNIQVIEPPEYNYFQRLVRKFIGGDYFDSAIQSRWIKFYETVAKRHDVYINIGGSIFIDNASINNRLYGEKVSIFSDMNKFIIGANFGPEKTNVYREKFSKIFSQFDDVCFRDISSKDKFSNLKNVRHADDVVFNLKVNNFSKVKDSVGVSVINLENRPELRKYKDRYDEYILATVRKLISDGKCVTFFSFCKHEGDEDIINYYLSNLPSEKIKVVNYDGDMDTFMDMFAKMESIIATRFHGIILALKNNQKLIPISYSRKTNSMLNSIQYPHKVPDIAGLKFEHNIDFNPSYTFIPKNEQFVFLDEVL